MERYQHKQDGKLHTRFSELRNCTPGGVARVVEARLLDLRKTNPYTEFGTTRHEVFANFLEKHGVLPKQIREQLGETELTVDRDCIERSYGIEVWENVVIHMTADLHNDTWVADFKTTTKGVSNYRSDKQIVFYAWLLNKMGHHITRGFYFGEVWDADRTQIQRYEVLEREFTDEMFAEIEAWAKLRVSTLYKELTKYTEPDEMVSSCCSAKLNGDVCADCGGHSGKVVTE